MYLPTLSLEEPDQIDYSLREFPLACVASP